MRREENYLPKIFAACDATTDMRFHERRAIQRESRTKMDHSRARMNIIVIAEGSDRVVVFVASRNCSRFLLR